MRVICGLLVIVVTLSKGMSAVSDTTTDSDAPYRVAPGQPQLFVDDALVARKSGVVRRTHPCTKLPEPVLGPEKPWEAHRIYVYGTVIRDPESGRFRMWYMSSGVALDGDARDPALSHRPMDLVLYATSEDGVHWKRPELGLYEFGGSKANNIVYDYHSPSILYVPDTGEPDQCFRMLGVGKANGTNGYLVAHSGDGLHWIDYPRNPALSGGDTCTLTWDHGSGEYLAFHKRYEMHRGHRRRLVYLATSPDMQTWSKPVLVLAPDEIDDAQTQREGGLFSQFYNLSAFPYGGQFLGLATHFRYTGPPPEKGPQQSSHDGPIDVQLVHSRDGRAWRRAKDRTPAIPNGPHAYDAGCILGVANAPVVVGDELWLYYTAITTTHGGYLPKKRIAIARASWRLDGFVSLDAADDGGVVDTVTLATTGRRLFVNTDASHGELTVEVLDGDGAPIEGYDLEHSVPVHIDGVRCPIRWQDRHELPGAESLRLRFRLRNARLFSYAME